MTSLAGFSQSVKTVMVSDTFIVPASMSVDEAKKKVVERAKIKAIEQTFGSIVTQHNSILVSNVNGKSDSYFHSLGASEIKGEWIETIGEPKFDIVYSENELTVSCSLKGKIREIMQPEIEFMATLTRNGASEKFASDEFKDGDEIYLLFRASVDGYISVFLNQNDMVYRLLPYKGENTTGHKISKNTSYIFFHKSTPDDSLVDEYVLYADNDTDLADVIILFSPTIPGLSLFGNDVYDEPLSTKFETFNDWIVKRRSKDIYSRLLVLPISISR